MIRGFPTDPWGEPVPPQGVPLGPPTIWKKTIARNKRIQHTAVSGRVRLHSLKVELSDAFLSSMYFARLGDVLLPREQSERPALDGHARSADHVTPKLTECVYYDDFTSSCTGWPWSPRAGPGVQKTVNAASVCCGRSQFTLVLRWLK